MEIRREPFRVNSCVWEKSYIFVTMKYVELILPLDLKECYHYRIDEDMFADGLAEAKLVGRRVVVSFGTKRFYTGIIRRLTADLPEGVEAKQIKVIESFLDAEPILSEEDLLFWEWMADYYQCSLGQVMREALPKGIVPESKTLVRLNEDFVATEQMPRLDCQILDTLAEEKGRAMTLTSLRSRLGRGASQAFDRLFAKGAVLTDETIQSRYKAKMKRYIRLAEGLDDDEALTEVLDGELKQAKKQQELLLEFIGALGELQEISKAKLSELSLEKTSFIKGDSARATHLRNLVNRGVLLEFERAVSRLDENFTFNNVCADIHHYPNESLSEGVHYLYTGNSLRKEDYFIAQIRQKLDEGGQVLLLSPNTLTANKASFYAKLHQALDVPIYYYNALTSEAKRCELMLKLGQKAEPCLIVGGRNAVFLPMARLSLIIVDEEQEYLYKQQFALPLYHSRDVALYLAHRYHIPILLASETPSAESLFNILRAKYHLLKTDEALREKPKLQVQIETIDLRKQRKEGRLPYGHSISQALRDEIKKNLEQGKGVLILKNRRGYAPYILCNNCSEHITCKRCDVAMNYHHSSRSLKCHYCGSEAYLPPACPSCGAKVVDFYGKERPALALVGYGTERVEEELKALFPKANVLRLDSESLQTKKRQQEVGERLSSGEVDIIVGTQLIKGQSLYFNDKPIGLMAVVQLDELLAYPDFRTEERAYQLLYQLLMRYSEAQKGKDKVEAKLLIQTNNPQQTFISKLRAFDYKAFIKEQLAERQLLNFPPFCRITYIRVKGFSEQEVHETALHLSALLRQYWTDFGRISEAQKPSVARIDNQYIRQITCKRPFQEPYRGERIIFRQVLEQIALLYPASRKVCILFDVDPL